MVKKKKKDRITLTVDITNLASRCKTPRNMRVWDRDNPMSEQVEKLINECTNLIFYIAKRLNEGPEVKTNIMKRALVTKAIIQCLLTQTCLDDLHRYGILDKVIYDLKARKNQPIILAVDEESINDKKEKNDKKRERYIT